METMTSLLKITKSGLLLQPNRANAEGLVAEVTHPRPMCKLRASQDLARRRRRGNQSRLLIIKARTKHSR
eukprot:8494308-Pyramimonas_sp.AAC.1